MRRDFHQLENGPFDLLVIGGGIYGAWVAYDAALRGLHVALVEQNDWASGTSSASSKLIHGGLRYLEYGWLGLVRKSLKERKSLWELAPHRIFSQEFIVPIYNFSRWSRWSTFLGLCFYDFLAGNKKSFYNQQYFSKELLSKQFPFLSSTGLRGGFRYMDGATDDARLTLEIVNGAHQHGAIVVNYAKTIQLISNHNQVLGVCIQDKLNEKTIEVSTKAIVNTTGAWVQTLGSIPSQSTLKVKYTKGVHLVLPQLEKRHAFLLTSPKDQRVFFLIPWYGRTLLGTTDTPYNQDPGNVLVEDCDIEYLLNSISPFLDQVGWNASHILGSFAGLRTLVDGSNKNPSGLKRDWMIQKGADNYWVSLGGKLSSARADAIVLVDQVCGLLGRKNISCLANRFLPWCPMPSMNEFLEDVLKQSAPYHLEYDQVSTLVRRYGTHIHDIFAIIQKNPELKERIIPDLPFCWAEIIYAVQHEMACNMKDVLRRRIPILILAKVPCDVIERSTRLMASVIGWTEQRIQMEIASITQ